MSNVAFPYLSLNRGRYLCPSHGAFCCDADGYLNSCPLCADEEGQLQAEINEPGRVLAIMNGLQARSARFGGMSAIAGALVSIAIQMGERVEANESGFKGLFINSSDSPSMIAIVPALLFFSAICMAVSMAHLPMGRTLFHENLTSETLKGKLVRWLRFFETMHLLGVVSFVLAATLATIILAKLAIGLS